MNGWGAVKAKRLLRALLGKGWTIKRTAGSHKTLGKSGYPDYTFAFHDDEEIGPKMLSKVAKHTGLKPEDL